MDPESTKGSTADEPLFKYRSEEIDGRLVQKKADEAGRVFKDFLEASLKRAKAAGSAKDGTAEKIGARLDAACGHFLEECARADLLAARYQDRFRNASKAVFLLAAAAVLIVSFQYIFFPDRHQIILAEIAATIALLSIITYGNRVGWHRRWLDYRFLAERLRAGLFVTFLADGSSDRIKENWYCNWMSDSWCIQHYREIWHGRPAGERLDRDAVDVMKLFFEKAWLEDQRTYHEEKMGRELIKHRRISQAGEFFFWSTLIVAVLHVLPHGLSVKLHLDSDPARGVMTFLAILFPILGSTFSALRAHFDYKKIAERSGMMARRLGFLKDELAKVSDIDGLGGLIRRAESLMAEESADWHVSMGMNELEKPG